MPDLLLWIALLIGLANSGALIFLVFQAARSSHDGAESALREELRAGRGEANEAARQLREEVGSGLKSTSETIASTIGDMGKQQKGQLESVTKQLKDLSDSNEQRLDRLRKTIDAQLLQLQEGNEKKLEEMRKTVDEKLQSTLEKRLGESFKIVSDRLEAVQKGLGEMKSLATGVGDLKRVLTNVKTRGTWGEVQLGAILEQILTPEQYDRNVQTKQDSRENVEFAIRLPGQAGRGDDCVWLPIDSKFPQEDYLRIKDAADEGDSEALRQAMAALARAVKNSAQEISEKYLNPPDTTDFAILFLPTEGLYAEVLRQPGLLEQLQEKYRVVIAGPSTLTAILNSLRLGFRTLAIEQRASEVWQVLAAVKTEFGKFGDVLTKVKKQLDTASKTIDQTGVRTRAIERKLRDVESLPTGQSERTLGLDTSSTGSVEIVAESSGSSDEDESE